jgi:hypothetical protein
MSIIPPPSWWSPLPLMFDQTPLAMFPLPFTVVMFKRTALLYQRALFVMFIPTCQ